MGACAVVDIRLTKYFKVFLGHSEKPLAAENAYKEISVGMSACYLWTINIEVGGRLVD